MHRMVVVTSGKQKKMTAKAKNVMTKMKTKGMSVAQMPERMIKQNLETPSNVLHIRTGLVDVDQAIQSAQAMVPVIKSTKAYQAAAKFLHPAKKFVQESEQFGDKNRLLKYVNRAKYPVAAAAGAFSPFPGSTEAIVGAASVPGMVGHAISKSPAARKAGKAIATVGRKTGKAAMIAGKAVKTKSSKIAPKAFNMALRALHNQTLQNITKI